MKTEKMSLANLEGKLSWNEMKEIMAGFQQTCTVTTTCIGGSVSCSGQKCARTNTSVTCDGVETKC